MTRTIESTSRLNLISPFEKVPLEVELRITKDYRTAGFTSVQSRVLEFGPGLTARTEEFARAVFNSVVVVESSQLNAPTVKGKTLLLPRIVDHDVLFPGGGIAITTLSVELSLIDGAGRLIWVDTFKSERRGQDIISLTGISAQVDSMYQDIFLQAQAAVSASPEIRRYATAARK